MNTRWIWMMAALLPVLNAQSAESAGPRVLLAAYFQAVLAAQISAQAEGLASGAPEPRRKEVALATSGWRSQVAQTVRTNLEARFGEQARSSLDRFVTEFTTAEKQGDTEYLARLARAAGVLDPLPSGYAELHRRVTADWLKSDVEAGAALLSEIQTWLDVAGRTPDPPSLAAWLARGSRTWAPAPQADGHRTASRPKALRDAEAEAGEFKGEQIVPGSALDTFAQARKDRRQRNLEDAHAGMQQVAAERDEAEREEAVRKVAAAQADAEAVKRHADKLAAAEAEALAQRKEGWRNKLKTVLDATVTAATGAFAGRVGAEAGRRLAEAVFDGD